MKVRSLFLIVILLSLSGSVLLGAQEAGQEVTVEELYLRNIEMQILREQAYTGDRDIKLMALNDLEAMIEDGDADERVVQPVLEYLAMEGISRRVRESNRLVNYFPEVRRRAANLLGRLGGERAKEALIAVLITDDESMVKAEAAYALGLIGLNDDNEVVKALLFSLSKENPYQPDNNFAYSICLALEKISINNNGIQGPEAPDAYRALIRITQGNYIQTVKRKALETLEDMKRY